MNKPLDYHAPVPHEAVTTAIDSERDYQIEKWGLEGAGSQESTNTVGNLILYTEDYLDEAMAQVLAGYDHQALHTVRKVGALTVACLERHSYQGFKDPRSRVYDSMQTSVDILERPFEQPISSEQLWDDLVAARQELLRVRRRAARTKGDSAALESLLDFGVSIYSIMRCFGSPLREKKSDTRAS